MNALFSDCSHELYLDVTTRSPRAVRFQEISIPTVSSHPIPRISPMTCLYHGRPHSRPARNHHFSLRDSDSTSFSYSVRILCLTETAESEYSAKRHQRVRSYTGCCSNSYPDVDDLSFEIFKELIRNCITLRKDVCATVDMYAYAGGGPPHYAPPPTYLQPQPSHHVVQPQVGSLGPDVPTASHYSKRRR
ncbi:hypothetical protein WA026_004665 [Henosepilachna vigintioctopunctata]|uniref:Uncharacterized protein n=1 Tax=Henosepilachna vigintioctopunctata TaxID=420089 RepID=A0AAW1V132_9CUCU